jgi:hypothetical protein
MNEQTAKARVEHIIWQLSNVQLQYTVRGVYWLCGPCGEYGSTAEIRLGTCYSAEELRTAVREAIKQGADTVSWKGWHTQRRLSCSDPW